MAENSEPVFQVNTYTEPVVIRISGRVSYLNALPVSKFFCRMEELDKLKLEASRRQSGSLKAGRSNGCQILYMQISQLFASSSGPPRLPRLG